MKKITLPLLLILFLFNCKKKQDDPATTSYDTENYFIIDGVTVYKPNPPKGGTVCNSPNYSWSEATGSPINYNLLTISNYDLATSGLGVIITVKYFSNGVTTDYENSTQLTKALPTKVVNGKTVIEFSNLKFYERSNPSNIKTISGKVTCN